MWKYPVLFCALLACVVLMVPVTQAPAQPGPRPGRGPTERPPADLPADATPEDVAVHCVEKVTEITGRCVQHNADLASMCVAKVNELFEAGEDDEALALAERCVGYVYHDSRMCSQHVKHACRRCVHVLNQMGADEELIERVTSACRTAAETIKDSADRAVEAISDAVGEDLSRDEPDDSEE